jgi:hypothetical protein
MTTQVRGAYDPWLSGAALLVLALLGLWIRRKFEKRDDDGPPAVPPDRPPGGSAPHDESDDEDRTPA